MAFRALLDSILFVSANEFAEVNAISRNTNVFAINSVYHYIKYAQFFAEYPFSKIINVPLSVFTECFHQLQ